MRQQLEYLHDRIYRIDGDNLYQAIADIKEVMAEIVQHLDKTLPIDKSDDV